VGRRIRSAREDDPEAWSVEIDGSDEILSGVSEEELAGGVVDGQRIRPAKVRLQDDRSVSSC